MKITEVSGRRRAMIWRRAQLDYAELSRPWIKLLCDIEAVTFHGTLIKGDGEAVRVELYTDEQKRHRAEIFEILATIKDAVESDLARRMAGISERRNLCANPHD